MHLCTNIIHGIILAFHDDTSAINVFPFCVLDEIQPLVGLLILTRLPSTLIAVTIVPGVTFVIKLEFVSFLARTITPVFDITLF